MSLLILFLGLAIDTGYIYVTRAQAQNVADAASLACVINSNANTCGTLSSQTFNGSNTLGGINAVNTNTALFNVATTYPLISPVTCPNVATQSNCAKAVVTATIKPFFMTTLNTVPINVSAIAGNVGGGASCITVIQDFYINGNNTASITNCSANIGGSFSSTNSSGILITGSGTTTVFNTSNIPSCNSNSPCPIASPSPLPVTKAFPVPSGLSTSTTNTTCATTGVCTAGIYTSKVTLQTTTKFGVGTYYFQQGLDTNGQTVTNDHPAFGGGIDGISLYVAKSLGLDGMVTLSAPALAGCVASSGVVVTEVAPFSSSTTKLNGSGNQLYLTGIVNIPDIDLINNGTASKLSITGGLVVKSLTLKGNMMPDVSPNKCYNLYNSSRIVLLQ